MNVATILVLLTGQRVREHAQLQQMEHIQDVQLVTDDEMLLRVLRQDELGQCVGHPHLPVMSQTLYLHRRPHIGA